jgi:hypothetical protein
VATFVPPIARNPIRGAAPQAGNRCNGPGWLGADGGGAGLGAGCAALRAPAATLGYWVGSKGLGWRHQRAFPLPHWASYLRLNTASHCAGRICSRFILTAADKDAGGLRRVLGTIVAMMLAGSALGLLGALIYPEWGAKPPAWSEADKRTPGRTPVPVRLELPRPTGHAQRHGVERALAPSGPTHPVRPTRS